MHPPRSYELSTAAPSAASNPARRTTTPSTRSCPSLRAQSLRCISQRNEGFTHVIRSSPNAAGNRPSAAAGSAISGRNAW